MCSQTPNIITPLLAYSLHGRVIVILHPFTHSAAILLPAPEPPIATGQHPNLHFYRPTLDVKSTETSLGLSHYDYSPSTRQLPTSMPQAPHLLRRTCSSPPPSVPNGGAWAGDTHTHIPPSNHPPVAARQTGSPVNPPCHYRQRPAHNGARDRVVMMV